MGNVDDLFHIDRLSLHSFHCFLKEKDIVLSSSFTEAGKYFAIILCPGLQILKNL
jgi:hypothetical protein